MSAADPARAAVGSRDPSVPGAVAFTEALRSKVEERLADGKFLAVLLVDCGVISRIDAVWGYHIGDAVRERVVQVLRSEVLRPDDLVGELGRDDFACVLSTVEGPAVALLAAKKSLRALTMPFWIGDEEIHASPSIGIAMCPTQGDQPEVLLQRAKSACTLASKLTGRIADYAEDRDQTAATGLLYENRLRAAISDDAFDMVFQPQFDLRRSQVMGAEGLLRWRVPGPGLINIEHAFVAAESAEMVTNLISSILNRALRNVSEFRYSAGLDLRVGVKLPASALRHAEVLEVVQRALGTWSRRPGSLILGIGETSVLHTDPVARETLGRLKEIGVKLSIDDPSMAMSSLGWLATLPFQEIKIDASGTDDLAAAPKSERIVQSLIELGHHLKLDVVAVGVGDDAAAERLKELGCDYMQGDFKGPTLDPIMFAARFGFNES